MKRDEIYKEMVLSINAMNDNELFKLINEDKCPYKPELDNLNYGQYKCPVCGEMIMAQKEHIRKV